jgi:TolB-like protein/tetratricopeptide (TPR) repeat protein
LSLFNELKRRNVFRVGIAYVIMAWLVLQVADVILNNIAAPGWVFRVIMLLLGIGFLLALFFAWAFEMTPQGLKRESEVDRSESITPQTSRKLNNLILAVMALALGYFTYDKFMPSRGDDAAPTGNTAVMESQLPGSPAASIKPDKSIAVLPFVNMSSDPEQEYFSDGIAEELLNRLAQIPDLKVAARTSAFQFKGKNLDIADIGRQLNVAHILEGSVRKGGTTLRITAQLIDTRTGFHLWSDTYDRDASDVLKVQDEIAGAIASALQSRLGGSAVASPQTRKINPDAYDDYLQGRAFVAMRYLDNLDKAIAAFDRAIARDPDYSEAYSGRGFAYLLRPLWGALHGNTLAIARESAEQALLLDPNNAEAFMVRGMVASFNRDATSARADLDHAQTLAPGSVDVINLDGDFHMNSGALGEAERLKRLAMTLDPLAFVHPMNLADVLIMQGRFEEAIIMAEQTVALGATAYGLDRLVFANTRAGRFEQAGIALEEGCALTGQTGGFCEGHRVMLLAATGDHQQAETMLDKLVSDIDSGRHPAGDYDLSVLASLYLEVTNIAKVTDLQKLALDENDWFPTNVLTNAPGGAKLPEEISTDPQWLAIWADPRMEDVMNVYRQNLLAWRAGSP